ncbi:hypothetical protein [Corynebacterium belfantii]|uniref:hypothetical protein n=1 Tax=Corynebacterium belfantii TaxID=2014537 RepID=UPI001FD502C4|nr:hypothetical protein [Corynebacterium belfantii]
MHVKCPQKFRVGSDFDGDVNAKVEKHLQRDCELTADQVSRLSIETKNSAKLREPGLVTNSTESLLKVNDVKAGDRKITGSVFLSPGQRKRVQLTLPGVRVLTADVELKGNSGEGGNTSKGKRVPFEFNVPDGIELKQGDLLLFSLRDDSPSSGAENNKNIPIYVKPADRGAESHPEQTPDGGNGQAPGGGAGGKPGKPSVPGADGNPRTGGGSLSSGSS